MDRFSLCALMVVLLPVKCLHVGDSCIADDQPGTCSRLSDCKPLLDEIRRAGRPMPIHLKMKLIDRSCGFESMEPVNFTVETTIVHKGYNPDTLVDDIALLRLAEPADLNLDNMKTICLPFMQKFQMADLIGYAGVVAGWGATEDGLQSSVLLKVDLLIVDNKECQEAYYGNSRIYERQLCAGGVQGKDSCVGDSGGPLLMFPALLGFREIQYVQMGIVSYGSMRCGLKGQPGVYTRIAFYMDWILDNMHE